MRIAFIGHGNVGGALANRLQRLGYSVTLGARDAGSEKLKKALSKNADLKTTALKDAVKDAEVIFLATPFQSNEEALKPVAKELKGKVLVDCTNPIGSGVTHGLNNAQSGSEFIQKLLPDTRVVKAFSIYGFENFEDNKYPGYNVRPAMLFCGNDAGAKKTVAGLIEQLGWKPLDVGGVEMALHLEHMTLLWVKMVRVNGHSPNFVWAILER
jgi:8-hydroxy-5-deazaflavin:NADPH oxidoreductase